MSFFLPPTILAESNNLVINPLCPISPPQDLKVDDLSKANCDPVVDDLGLVNGKKAQTNSNLPTGESIVTLLPYVGDNAGSNNFKNKTGKAGFNKHINKSRTEASVYEEIFGPSCWPRFFNINLKKNYDFTLDELLLESGHQITLNKQRSGLRLVEVHTKSASDTLINWTINPPENMEVGINENLNHTYGTVVIPDDIECEGVDYLDWGPKIEKT